MASIEGVGTKNNSITNVLIDRANKITNNNEVISDFIFFFTSVSATIYLNLVNNDGYNNDSLQLNPDNYVYKY